MNITIIVGARSNTLQVPHDTTVGQVAGNQNYRATFQLPENATTLVNGRQVSSNFILSDGDELSFERQACAKA